MARGPKPIGFLGRVRGADAAPVRADAVSVLIDDQRR